MNIDKLIAELQSLQKEYGDIEVMVWEDDISQFRWIYGIHYDGSENAIILDA
jgi:hypothetical protein